MELGMHPAILYPRRSQFRPLEVSRVRSARSAFRNLIVRQTPDTTIIRLKPDSTIYESWNASYSAICRHENKLHAMQSPFSCASALVDA